MSMSNLQMLVRYSGRTQRADMDSQDMSLPKNQRNFHAGRREAYLQMMADIAEVTVREMRETVLGDTAKSSKKRDRDF